MMMLIYFIVSFSAFSQESCSLKSLECITLHIESYQKNAAENCMTTNTALEKIKDYAPAMYPLALCKLVTGKPEDLKKACELFQKSVDQGYGRAGFYASQCLSRESEIAISDKDFSLAKLKTNDKLALKYLKIASGADHPIAMILYSKKLNSGSPEWIALMEKITHLKKDESVYGMIKLIEFYQGKDIKKAKALYKELSHIPYYKEETYQQHPVFGPEFLFGFASEIQERMICLDYQSPEEKIDWEARCHEDFHTQVQTPETKQKSEQEYFKCATKSRNTWALMEVYANGLGTKMDVNLAIRYACQSPEFYLKDGLPKLLDKKAGKTKDPIWFCDYGMTTPVSNLCADLLATKETNQNLAAMNEIMKNWKEKDKAQFQKLSEVFTHFLEEEIESHLGPYSSRGTAAPSFLSDFSAKGRKNFFNLVKEATQKKPKELLQSADYKKADKELNETYKKVLASFEKTYADEKDNLKEAIQLYKTSQRKWIIYRDQFASFLSEYFKGSFSEAELKTHGATLLTKERTKLFKDCYLFEGDHSESQCPYSF
jgi:uncharacterized protein YecT (DUF1311 family)/TPR repeat protein